MTHATARHGALQLPNHYCRPSSRVGNSCMHVACNQHHSRAYSNSAQYILYLVYLPMRLTSPTALALVAVRREKKKDRLVVITSPTTHLGSWHPFPPAYTSIVLHSGLLPVRRSPSSELSLTSAHRQSPWPHVATGSPRGVVPTRKFVGSIVHHDAQLPGAGWCRARHAPHPPMYEIQVLATRATHSLCSSLGHPVRATT